MPDKSASDFYPAPTGNQTADQALRLAFDYIYKLRARLGKLEVPEPDRKPDLATPGAIVENPPFGPDQVCQPTAFTNPRQVATDLNAVYAVVARQEYVYLQGGSAAITGHFRVYRIKQDNTPVLVGALDTTEVFERLLVSGPYAFGARVDGGSPNLTIISVTRPNAPQEVVVFNVGAAINGLAVQGRFVACACADGTLRLVDISVPASPRVVGSAS